MMSRKFTNYYKNTLKSVFIISITVTLPLSVHAQVEDMAVMDTVKLKKGNVITVNKKSWEAPHDTIIILPHKLKYIISKSREDKFYESLENRAGSKFLTRELHDIIIAAPSKNGNSDSLNTIPSIQPFMPYQERPIRNIIIRQLQVFGPTIEDTGRIARSFIERTANRVHFQTKKYLIRNNLLFKSGELVNPVILADNERILRSLPYIEDAKIEILPEGVTDTVDVLVLVKDLWPKAFNVEVKDIYSGLVELWDRNVLGLGHQIQNNILWDSRENPSFGYNGIYKVNNIAGSFINGDLKYFNSFQTKIAGINFERSFFTPNIKYAGGFNFENINKPFLYKPKPFLPEQLVPIKYNHFETWVGRSFLLTNKKKYVNTRQNITIAAKIKKDYFYYRPYITENSYYTLQNKTLSLVSISYTRQQYFKSNLIYNFGRTEDIPVGSEIGLTFGLEDNEFSDRSYGAFIASVGKFVDNIGYAHTSLSAGSFYANNNFEQGVIKGSINYFSNIFVINRFNLRQFVNINLIKGINRFDNEYLTISQPYGIDGFRNDSVTGNIRFNVNWESVIFTPWKFYGFKFVAFVFGDHSWISRNDNTLFHQKFYSGLGFGFRIRNERLVFNTFQIKFAFYPNIPQFSDVENFAVSSEPVLTHPSFIPKAPDITQFR